MIRSFCLITSSLLALSLPALAQDRSNARFDANGNLDALVAKHAAANNVPAELIRRVIKRESGGNPRAVNQGNLGLMQIKLATARGLGYRGTAEGLLDADTNMTYAVKYLAGAYRVADGNHGRAVQYYAAGYYYAAKRKGMSVQAAASVKNPGTLDGNGSPTYEAPRVSRAAAQAMAAETGSAQFGVEGGSLSLQDRLDPY